VIAGCVAQQEQARLLKRTRHLDAVVGTHNISELPVIVERITETGDRIASIDFSTDVESLHLPAPHKGPSPVCSYVTIMQGCSNFCTYCVVPHTRGREQSRDQDQILHEVEGLVEKGVREITLLGQNVNAYGKDLADGNSFAGLLTQLDRTEGLSRIRFTTSHPKDLDDSLVQRIADLESVCEHIHLPLQSGSDRILSAMNRKYTMAQYLEEIARLREASPGIAITADMIVGFPGETDQDFDETISALEQIRFDQIFSFKFSRRPGTAACSLPDQIPDEIKAQRLATVHSVQDRITQQYHTGVEGTVAEILIEGIRERSGQPYGRTRSNKIVNLDSSDSVQIGDLIPVEITKGLKHSLLGKALSPTVE
jgi:tRNA-2-methylthio-N6-dimethylallyladenosine synthase